MKSVLNIAAVALLISVPSECFALMSIENVTRERAKELGLQIRANAAGPDTVRVEMEFEIKGELKNFSRVDLELHDGGKLLMTSTLREDKSKAGRVVVSFAADRGKFDQITLRIVTQSSARSRTGHDVRVKYFVDLKEVR